MIHNKALIDTNIAHFQKNDIALALCDWKQNFLTFKEIFEHKLTRKCFSLRKPKFNAKGQMAMFNKTEIFHF